MNSLRSTSSWLPTLLARPAVQPRSLARLYSSQPSITTAADPEPSTSAAPQSPVAATSSTLDALQASLEAEAESLPSSLTSSAHSDGGYPPDHFRHGTSMPGQAFKRKTHEEAWAQGGSIVDYSLPFTPTSARSIAVRNNDLATAYRKLNRTLMENNVRRELRQQERFESGSDRRVRLNSERHRRRFKVAVGKAVGLAMRMKDL